MSADLLFGLALAVATPFWGLMIVLPKWRGTKLVTSSPWVVAPVLVVWLITAWPVLGELVPSRSGAIGTKRPYPDRTAVGSSHGGSRAIVGRI